jgi:hypothetical protein
MLVREDRTMTIETKRRDVRLRVDGTAYEAGDRSNYYRDVDVELPPDTEVYVNVYEVSRCYGGPEEGGWWYDWEECIKAIPCDLKDAKEIRRRLMADRYSNEDRRDIGSVLSDYVYAVYIEWEAAESQSTQRPRYE